MKNIQGSLGKTLSHPMSIYNKGTEILFWKNTNLNNKTKGFIILQ